MNGIRTYQDTAVTTQSKGRLIVMLYEGAVKFLKLAIQDAEAENYEAKGNHINAGGEIAGNLRRLYCFMNDRLSQANAKNDPQMIREVITLLEELNQGWKAIAD